MNPIAQYLKKHQMTQVQLARELDVTDRTIRRWIAGDTRIPAAVLKLLKLR